MHRTLFLLIIFISGNFIYAQVNKPATHERVFERAHTDHGLAICGSCNVPENTTSKVVLAPLNEPGERLIISGTIYEANGTTPAKGVTLFLYQADAGGYYHRPKEDVFSPHLFGWLRTGEDGSYEIRTIRPETEVLAPDEPAHIHAQVFGAGISEHFIPEFWFSGDPRIKSDQAKELGSTGKFSPILHLKKDDQGVWRGVRDIRLKPTAQWHYETP